MKLLNITLKNFMPYFGAHRIVLPGDGEANVVVIYGDNMFGKTSILTAIKWGLYGRAQGRHLRPIDDVKLINRDAARQGDWTMEVSIRFEDEGNKYVLQRLVSPRPLITEPEDRSDLSHTVTLLKNDIAVRHDLIAHEINQVLPETISRFSLFDGELLEEYEQLVLDESTQADRIKDKIEEVLGLPTLTHARDDLNVLLVRAQKALAKASKASDNLAGQSERLSKLQDEKESLGRSLGELKLQETALVDEIDDLRDAVEKAARSESVKARIDTLRRQLDDLGRDRKALAEQYQRAITRVWTAVVGEAVVARRERLQEHLSKSTQSLTEALRTAVQADDIAKSLNTKTCQSCGQDLPLSAVADLKQRLDAAKRAATRVSAAQETIARVESSLRDLRAFSDVGLKQQLLQMEERRAQLEVEKVRLTSELDEQMLKVADVDLELVVQNRQQLERKNRLLGQLSSDIKSVSQQVDKRQKEIDLLSAAMAVAADPALKKVSLRVKVLQSLVKVFSSGVGSLRDALRSRVEQGATAAFRAMTTDKTLKGLRINNRYGLNIIDERGDPVPLRSAGAEQIVALSLIDGLSKATGKDLPLIMDTPFGRLDRRHRKNVLSHLPTMATQVVLLVHEGEMDKQRDMSCIANQISAAMEIRRETPTQSKVVNLG